MNPDFLLSSPASYLRITDRPSLRLGICVLLESYLSHMNDPQLTWEVRRKLDEILMILRSGPILSGISRWY
jgi:hypothetical protein